MENNLYLNKLFLETVYQKPKRSLFYKKPKYPNKTLQELNEMILSPLKLNIKKDILQRANKLAPQITLTDAVLTIKNYFKKNKLNLEQLLNFNSSYYNNLNKQSHSERVLVYILYLSVMHKLSANDIVVLTDAAKLHDIGRNTPDSDLLHGQKSVGIIKFYHLIEYPSQSDYNALLAVIDAHSAYDKNIEGVLNKYDIALNQYDRVKQLCFLLKDAEALDKVRFFTDSAVNTERMLKTNLLKTTIAKQMVGMAFELNDYYVKNLKTKPAEDGRM